jgi:hypothetical protein
MRPKKRSAALNRNLMLAIANQAAMGVALGLAFALIVVSIPAFGIASLIELSPDPANVETTFQGTAALMFGIGSALTGLVFMMEDE